MQHFQYTDHSAACLLSVIGLVFRATLLDGNQQKNVRIKCIILQIANCTNCAIHCPVSKETQDLSLTNKFIHGKISRFGGVVITSREFALSSWC